MWNYDQTPEEMAKSVLKSVVRKFNKKSYLGVQAAESAARMYPVKVQFLQSVFNTDPNNNKIEYITVECKGVLVSQKID